MRKIFPSFILLVLFSSSASSQGCVAIRNLAGFGQFAQLGYGQTSDRWALDINNRYFEAWRFLEGKQDISPTDPKNNLVLYEYEINFGLTRTLDKGWSVALNLPISANTAVSSLEHASGDRHSTHAYGVGDIRFAVYKWILNTEKPRKGNIQAGLGIKFPTGNYKTEDYFYNDPNDPTAKVLAPVNVAIQLGDGGTGITTELNGFYIFNPHLSIFGNLFYLISPKDQNGVAAWPPGIIPDNVMSVFHQATYDVNSVPDNYTLRAGVNYSLHRLVGTIGLRYEGAPAHDLVGGNDGLRRVGHIFSVEPGVQYKFKHSYVYGFVTIPVDRATIQNEVDKRITQITGQNFVSPGHFANAVFFLGYAFTF